MINGYASHCPLSLFFSSHFLTTMVQNRAILREKGKSNLLISDLLEDGQKWADYRVCLRDHISESKKLQKRFETDPVFYHEVWAHERTSQKPLAQPESDREMTPQAILRLKTRIDEMERVCKEKISELEARTNKMIEMVSVWSVPPFAPSRVWFLRSGTCRSSTSFRSMKRANQSICLSA